MPRHRIKLFMTLALGLLMASLLAEAQPAGKVPRIGVIVPGIPPGASGDELDGFRQGLRALGYVEGQTITLEVRWGEEQRERYPALAAELVQLPVDIIVAAGGAAARAARHTTSTIPIVMVAGVDPVAQGLVASLAHPGGNITGLTIMTRELTGKRLELLQEAVPGLSHVALLVDAGSPNRQVLLDEHEAAARVLGVQLLPLEVRGPDEFVGAFQAATQGQAQALITGPSALFFTHRARLAELALASRLPTMAGETGYAAAGGLMYYGPDIPGSFRRVAVYVDKILKGIKPADLPVEQPTTFELAINLKTAQALGLTIPPTLLLQATEVIR
jgi:putative tryptophan/tyrosine transport system substrate-binding protein